MIIYLQLHTPLVSWTIELWSRFTIASNVPVWLDHVPGIDFRASRVALRIFVRAIYGAQLCLRSSFASWHGLEATEDKGRSSLGYSQVQGLYGIARTRLPKIIRWHEKVSNSRSSSALLYSTFVGSGVFDKDGQPRTLVDWRYEAPIHAAKSRGGSSSSRPLSYNPPMH